MLASSLDLQNTHLMQSTDPDPRALKNINQIMLKNGLISEIVKKNMWILK